MARWRQATSHHLNQWWPRSPTPYDVTRPHWFKPHSIYSYASLLWSTYFYMIIFNCRDATLALPLKHFFTAWQSTNSTKYILRVVVLLCIYDVIHYLWDNICVMKCLLQMLGIISSDKKLACLPTCCRSSAHELYKTAKHYLSRYMYWQFLSCLHTDKTQLVETLFQGWQGPTHSGMVNIMGIDGLATQRSSHEPQWYWPG